MDEIYLMLGREHQADLEREALKFRRAAAVRRSGRDHIGSRPWRRWTTKRFVRARLISFVVRIVRASSLSGLLVLALLSFVAAGCGSGGTAKASKVADDTADVVRAVERDRLRALLGHDLDAARKLHADDFELINPLGEVVSKEAYLDSGAAFAYTVWKPMSPIRVRVYGDAAVIRYESDLEIHGNRGHDWHTDVYEKRDGRWQVVWSQTTAAP